MEAICVVRLQGNSQSHADDKPVATPCLPTPVAKGTPRAAISPSTERRSLLPFGHSAASGGSSGYIGAGPLPHSPEGTLLRVPPPPLQTAIPPCPPGCACHHGSHLTMTEMRARGGVGLAKSALSSPFSATVRATCSCLRHCSFCLWCPSSYLHLSYLHSNIIAQILMNAAVLYTCSWPCWNTTRYLLC